MEKDCIFCNIDLEKTVLSNDSFIAVMDEFPVSNGHMLIISRRHINDIFELTMDEAESLQLMIVETKRYITAHYNHDGFNIGCNCGEAAGQTVMHFHMHVIPRYKGDVKNPRGGVRGVIPSKRIY